MEFLLATFKTISMIFAVSAVATGAQSIVDPIGFSGVFGLPLTFTKTDFIDDDDGTTSKKAVLHHRRRLILSYVSLMGVRQLATGIVLLTFAYQGKWTEMATILAIIGIVVAGTDGVFLSRAGARKLGQFHAIPGALIAALAGGVICLT